jgi:hypothetical protein
MDRCTLSALMLWSLMGTGCVSISQVQTADTLGADKLQLGLEPGFAGAAVFAKDESFSFYYPHVDVSLRYGLTERVDVGVRFGSSLLELQSKLLLTSPEDPDKAVSLAPSLMWFFLGGDVGDAVVDYANLAVPLLVGLKMPGGSEFVVGPRLNLSRFSLGTGGAEGRLIVASAGLSVGYALRFGENFRLLPEVAISYPLLGALDISVTDSRVLSGFNSGFAQVKLGFLFGGGRPAGPTD